MHVAEMTTEHFHFVALGKTKVGAAEAMAAGFDRHLQDHGDENRERFLYDIGHLPDGEPVELGFGADVRAFAVALDEWYGIAVFTLKAGEAKEHGQSDGWR